MAGPAFSPEATIALAGAEIAVMGPEAAVNAVYANHIAAIADETERAAFIEAKRAEYIIDVDLFKLASELVVDDVIELATLRSELIRRYSNARRKPRRPSDKHHGVYPV